MINGRHCGRFLYVTEGVESKPSFGHRHPALDLNDGTRIGPFNWGSASRADV